MTTPPHTHPARHPEDLVTDFATVALRGFYEHSVNVAAGEMAEATLPSFDDLDAAQRRAWTLALAATSELAVRMVDAFTSVGLDLGAADHHARPAAATEEG